MSYTLMKGLGWFIAAFLLGVVIGWLLRSVSARRQVARARSTPVEPAPAARPTAVASATSAAASDPEDGSGSFAADDLKVIPGIGPNVEELCNGIGIRTWSDLAGTEVSLLRTMLADAGPRFRAVDPSQWPALAGLLADGRWAEFESRSAAQPDPARPDPAAE